MKFIKIFIITLTFSLSLSIPSYAKQSVEEIIKGRKAMLVKTIKMQNKLIFYLNKKKLTKLSL